MRAALANRALRWTALLVTVVACGCGPSVGAPKLTKDRAGKEPSTIFNAYDTIYAQAPIGSASGNTKVMGRLAIVDVAGRPAGVIPTFDMTMEVIPGMNQASFTFSAPLSGWPDGKYRIDIVVLDASDKPKTTKSAEFTTTGHEPLPKRTPR